MPVRASPASIILRRVRYTHFHCKSGEREVTGTTQRLMVSIAVCWTQWVDMRWSLSNQKLSGCGPSRKEAVLGMTWTTNIKNASLFPLDKIRAMKKSLPLINWFTQQIPVLESSVTQLCLTICNPMDYSPTGSSVHGIFQARILVWVATSSSRGSSQPRDRTHISCIFCIGRRILYHWATWEVPTNTY